MTDEQRQTIEHAAARYSAASKNFEQAQALLNGLARDLRDVGGEALDDDLALSVRRRYEHAREAYARTSLELANAARERLESGAHLTERDRLVLECEAAR